MDSDPGRIADYNIEAAIGGNVGKMSAERKGERCAVSQGFDFPGRISDAAPDRCESNSRLIIRRVAKSEQVYPAHHRQHLFAIGRRTHLSACQNVDCS